MLTGLSRFCSETCWRPSIDGNKRKSGSPFSAAAGADRAGVEADFEARECSSCGLLSSSPFYGSPGKQTEKPAPRSKAKPVFSSLARLDSAANFGVHRPMGILLEAAHSADLCGARASLPIRQPRKTAHWPADIMAGDVEQLSKFSRPKEAAKFAFL